MQSRQDDQLSVEHQLEEFHNAVMQSWSAAAGFLGMFPGMAEELQRMLPEMAQDFQDMSGRTGELD